MSADTTTRTRDDSRILGQVPANAEIFAERHEQELLATYRNHIALMSNGELIKVFPDLDAAFDYADEHDYRRGGFSLHHVGPVPDLMSGAYTVHPPSALTQ